MNIVPSSNGVSTHPVRHSAKASSAVAPSTLRDLVDHLRDLERRENPDVVLDLRTLRMTPDGLLNVPSLGDFAFTEWSRSQLASLLGIRWDRWAENASVLEIADEVNRRILRATGDVRVRTTTRERSPDLAADGAVRAIVTPGYTPVADSQVARLLGDVLPERGSLDLVRYNLTDKTTSFVVGVGAAFRPDHGSKVGDVRGTVTVRNSGTGFASLYVAVSLLRLICLNGMTAPAAEGAEKRAHRALDEARIKAMIQRMTAGTDDRIRRAAALLAQAESVPLARTVPETIEDLLRENRLPKRLATPIMHAYEREPEPTKFGISQALTLAAQDQAAEVRLDLERVAGAYVEAS